MKMLIVTTMMLLLAVGAAYGQEDADVLEKVLTEVGFTRADLGYRPTGYWNRFPLDTPYRLTSFDHLFAEPLMLYDYGKTMANAVEKYLAPGYLDSNSISLYALTYSLGVDRKLGGFRSYSANLIPVSDSIRPLEKAFAKLFQSANQSLEYYSFGDKAKLPNYMKSIDNLSQDHLYRS